MANLFPDPGQRNEIQRLLEQYTDNEAHRVRMGVLKASRGDLKEIERLARLAQLDYRDLLVEAEYPLSFGKQALREQDPEKYAALIEKEMNDYDQWLADVLES